MKQVQILQAMEHVDAQLILEADCYQGGEKKRSWLRWGGMAACLCLIVAGALAAGGMFRQRGSIPEDASFPHITAAAQANDRDEASGTEHNGMQSAAATESGLWIPAITLPEHTEANTDMINVLVYRGGIYTQAQSFCGAEAEKIDALLGDYLGYATGTIDEWSTQDEYAVEFASGTQGDVYTVQGYDTGFRLCIRSEIEGETGAPTLWIQFLDRLNGITLNNGADLFEDRLQLRGRITEIRWQSHEDWDWNGGNFHEAALEPALWDKFLDQLDQNLFVNTWDSENTTDTIYDTEAQAHLLLTMEDGTEVPLRLIAGGYVGMDYLGWYFVRMPGEVFDAVYHACGGNA